MKASDFLSPVGYRQSLSRSRAAPTFRLARLVIILCIFPPSLVLAGQAVPQEVNKHQEIIALKPAHPIEAGLNGGGTNVYRIQVENGQFAHVTVEQEGIDVVIRILKPDGQKVLEGDSFNGAWGPEEASFIAETAGDYQLTVSSFSPRALPGHYSVRIDYHSVPSPEDKKRIAAEQQVWEVVRLLGLGTADARKEAIASASKMPELWRSLGDEYQEALSYFMLGNLYLSDGNVEPALSNYNTALSQWRRLGDRQGEASALFDIGRTAAASSDRTRVVDSFDQALQIWRTLNDKIDEAKVLRQIGQFQDRQGDRQKALDFFTQSLQLQEFLGDKFARAVLLGDIGVVYWELGEQQKALEYCTQALAYFRAVDDRPSVAATLDNLGKVYNDVGETEKALESYKESLTLWEAIGDKKGQAVTLHNLGVFSGDRGDKEKALEYYMRALSLREAWATKRVKPAH